MPPVFVAIGAAVSAALGSITVASIVGTLIKGVIAFGLSTLLGRALAKKPKTPTFSQQLQDRTLTARQPIQNRRYIYGICRVGGAMTLIHTTGSKKEYLHLIITVAGHQIESFDAILIDGVEVRLDSNGNALTPDNYNSPPFPQYVPYGDEQYVGFLGIYRKNLNEQWERNGGSEGNPINYNGHLRVKYNLGGANQAAFQDLINEAPDIWDENCRQRGCASAYVRLKYDQDVYPNGIPDISFIVRGKNDIYDPRDESVGFTNNSALVLADYLTQEQPLGVGVTMGTELIGADLIEAANICDEQVATGGSSPQAYENRYETNGSFDESVPANIIPELVGAMAGYLVLQGNRFVLRAGAYRTPTLTLDEDDVIGPVTIQTMESIQSSFNSVRGVFTSPDTNFQPTDFPAIKVASYIAEDDGWEVWNDLELNYTTSETMSQRIARILLELQRRRITVAFKAKMKAYQLQPGDTVMLSLNRYGWVAKTFLVESIQLDTSDEWGVQVELREIDANVYAWSTSDEGVFSAAPVTNLPSPFNVDAPGLSLSDTIVVLNSGIPGTEIIATVEPPNDVFVREYEVQYKLSSESDWTSAGRSISTLFRINNVSDGVEYDVRVRGINTAGVKSAWFTRSNYTVIGQTEPPQNVASFTIDVQDRQALLRWSPVPDLDIQYYVIRYTPETDLASVTWEGSQLLVRKVAKPATSVTVPAMVGTYSIKAVDYGGRVSETATFVVNGIDGTATYDIAETVTEQPGFTGTKVDVVKNTSGYLVLATTGGASSGGSEGVIDLFARSDFFGVSDFFTGGSGSSGSSGSGHVSSGTYYFAGSVNLGGVYTARIVATMKAFGENSDNDFFGPTNFFEQDNIFSEISSNWDVELQIRTTQDDPSGSPVTWSDWKTFVTGDYLARGLQFRAVLSTDQTNITPAITQLVARVDVKEQTQGQTNQTVTAAGRTFTFPVAFRTLAALDITAENMQSGDYYTITGKSATGFTITFYDNTDTAVERTMDYIAHGYGKAAT